MPAYGRGGAGNIEAATAQATQLPTHSTLPIPRPQLQRAANSEVCAQNHGGEVVPESDPADPPEYKHSGRGGAGNYYEPRVLAQSGTFMSTSTTAASPPAARASGEGKRASGMFQYRGRGGAGNYEGSAEIKAEAEEQAKLVELEISQRAREDVELGLSKPEQVHLGGRQRVGSNAGWDLSGAAEGAVDERVEAEMLRYT